MKRRACFLTDELLVAGATPALPQADEPDAFTDGYQNGDYGRVRWVESGGAILRATTSDAEGHREPATPNAPVFPGDRVRTAYGERLEVQLAGGGLVRIDEATEMSFLALPDPYAEIPDHTVLQVHSGSIRVTVRVREGQEFRVDAPSCSVYLLGDGDLRIDVDSLGRTRIASRRGVAEAAGDGGSVLVRGGMRTSVAPGSAPDDPQSFNTLAADAFDEWVETRDATYRDARRQPPSSDVDPYADLPVEIRPYYNELSLHGRWVYLPTFGYSWYPFDRGPGWRPYLDGTWVYGDRGYFWVSAEPWGWAPYHYGRWTWVAGYGWCWVPGSVFAGAWVSWSWGTAYVGWCPLDYWNRPAFHGPIYHGYYDPHCWTFVGYGHLTARSYRRHAVSVEHIGPSLHRAAVVTRPPRTSPRALAGDATARDQAFREATADRRSRIRPVIDRTANPVRSFGDLEREIRSGRSRSRSQPATAGAAGASGLPGREQPPATAPRGRDARPGAARQEDRVTSRAPARRRESTADAGPGGRGTPSEQPAGRVRSNTQSPRESGGGTEGSSPAPAKPQPRLQSPPPRGAARTPKALEAVPRRIQAPERTGAAPTEGPVRGSPNAGERIRELYRRMASPRVAKEDLPAPPPRPEPQASDAKSPETAPRSEAGSKPPAPSPSSGARVPSRPPRAGGNSAGETRKAAPRRESAREGKKR